jgi:hypothetical protein
MYLRTTQRRNKDSSIVQYYQLAHNERHPVIGKPVANIAEISCGQPWSRIRSQLEKLQISEFLTPEYGFFSRNELPADTRNILKILNVSVPLLLLGLEKL